MAEIVPFRGIRYNRDKITNIKKVVAPPYDVISAELQDELYARHSENIIRLILGKENSGDDYSNNRYSRAAANFNKWLSNSTLIQDSEPAFYVYSQHYSFNNVNRIIRTGIIGRYKLEEFGKGKIHPHEQTLSKPKEDRFRLTVACKANFSQIFGLYDDPEDRVMKVFEKHIAQPPIIDFIDYDKVRHLFWKITDPDANESVITALADKEVFIADGHHRYETAINYMNAMKSNNPFHNGSEDYNYVMMYLTNMSSDGLSIFPTHRVLNNVPAFNANNFLDKLSLFFYTTSLKIIEYAGEQEVLLTLFKKMEEVGKNKKVMGLFLGGDEYLLLILKDERIMDKYTAPEKSAAWKSLDVSILHTLLLEQILSLTEKSQKEQKNITYTVHTDQAVNAVKSGKAQAAFFLNATKIEEVRAIASSGEKMPQKSTFFYPKLISGLVVNKL